MNAGCFCAVLVLRLFVQRDHKISRAAIISMHALYAAERPTQRVCRSFLSPASHCPLANAMPRWRSRVYTVDCHDSLPSIHMPIIRTALTIKFNAPTIIWATNPLRPLQPLHSLQLSAGVCRIT